MSKRFEELEAVYNTLTAINFDFNQLPATNKYLKYKEWKQDPDKRKRPSTSIRDTGRKAFVGLKAFGLNGTGDADNVKVKLGQRVRDYIASLSGAPQTNLELVTSGDLSSYAYMNGFRPAKVVAALRSSSASTPTSEITGEQYKKRTGQSYTIPFGKGAAPNDTEFAQQERLIAAYDATHVVTFLPESLGRR